MTLKKFTRKQAEKDLVIVANLATTSFEAEIAKGLEPGEAVKISNAIAQAKIEELGWESYSEIATACCKGVKINKPPRMVA